MTERLASVLIHDVMVMEVDEEVAKWRRGLGLGGRQHEREGVAHRHLLLLRLDCNGMRRRKGK